jgi:hypothetical protein
MTEDLFEEEFEENNNYAAFCFHSRIQNNKIIQQTNFLKNVNKKFEDENARVIVARKKIGFEYLMIFSKNLSSINLSKNAMRILLFCQQNAYFCNIVMYSKSKIAEKLNVRLDVVCNCCKELVKNRFLLHIKSRKYLVIHPVYGWKGGVGELGRVKNLIEKNEQDKISNFFEKAYVKAQERLKTKNNK